MPNSTLRGCVRNGNKSLGRPAIIPQPEHELSEYILNMESMLFVLTVDDLKLLVYELAVKSDLQNLQKEGSPPRGAIPVAQEGLEEVERGEARAEEGRD